MEGDVRNSTQDEFTILTGRPIPIGKTMMHKQKSALSGGGSLCVRHYECLIRIILQLSSEIKANGWLRNHDHRKIMDVVVMRHSLL